MSVKLSDLIWTVICFGLFMLVFNKLLLSPVLKFMDARREKIEGAKRHAEEAERERAELEEKRLARSAEREKALLREREERISQARAEAEREIAALEAALKAEAGRKREGLDALAAEAEQSFDKAMDSYEKAFAEKLFGVGGQ
jgi:F0F1-type ATP synthase membrane subunit b/b'